MASTYRGRGRGGMRGGRGGRGMLKSFVVLIPIHTHRFIGNSIVVLIYSTGRGDSDGGISSAGFQQRQQHIPGMVYDGRRVRKGAMSRPTIDYYVNIARFVGNYSFISVT